MTDEQFLSQLVEKGSAIGLGGAVAREGYLCGLSVCEMVDGKLFWVELGAENQHHAHAIPFNNVAQVGEVGLSFFQGTDLAAYVALFTEWPSINTDDANEALAEWRIETSVDKAWKAFVDDMRSELAS